MSESAELLFANDAFYQFFRVRDVKGMDGLWARAAPVACIHPGWQALTTRRAVMRSWRRILDNPDAPEVVCRAPRATFRGGLGFVICYEVIGKAVLVATNVFVREDGAWKMIHHQAGPCGTPPAELDEEPEPRALQ